MLRIALLLTLVASAFLTGCATTSETSGDNVSNIPWNRPESWEGQGPMGGMMNSR